MTGGGEGDNAASLDREAPRRLQKAIGKLEGGCILDPEDIDAFTLALSHRKGCREVLV
jgi:hypothetical protein